MMIACRSVSKTYATRGGEVRSLDQLDLEIRQGEFVAVQGGSGSGKTTLLLALGGMLRPSSGRVEFRKRDLYGLSSGERAAIRARSVGFVFQMFHLVPYLNTLENVLMAAGGKPSGDQRKRATELLEGLGMSHRLTHRPGELSAGERQRAAIGRALLNQPDVILADEPTGNLDPENTAEVFQHLSAFHQGGGTVVVVTHGEAADGFADRVIRLRQGRIDTGNTKEENS